MREERRRRRVGMEESEPDQDEASSPLPTPALPTPALPPLRSLNAAYAACEALVAVAAVLGNALVMLVFRRERRLRRRTNYYIVSLAAADFLVGLLGVPFAVLASVGLPRNLHACLFTVSTLVVLCTISIFCLVAVSVDRYWAILHPMGYSRNVRTRTAVGIIGVCWLAVLQSVKSRVCLCLGIIGVCWLAGSLVGFLPLLGWHEPGDGVCLFTQVMDYDYLVFLYFATIVFPALLLAAFYIHIYRVVLQQRRPRGSLRLLSGGGAAAAASGTRTRGLPQLRRIVTMDPTHHGGGGGAGGGGTMLRMLGPIKKSEVKATQNLSIIVLFFILCWFPLYTINCIQAFRRDWQVNGTLMDCCIVLSHLNSAGNPLLYAYHLRDFRAALKALLWRILGLSADPSPGDQEDEEGRAGRGSARPTSQRPLPLPPAPPHSHALTLAPPTRNNTAHSSMTSVADSLPPTPTPNRAEGAVAGAGAGAGWEGAWHKMSTVAEASQSEEEPSTPVAYTSPSRPQPNPSPKPNNPSGRPRSSSNRSAGGCEDAQPEPELEWGEDDVFEAGAASATECLSAPDCARSCSSAGELRPPPPPPAAPLRRAASADKPHDPTTATAKALHNGNGNGALPNSLGEGRATRSH